MVRAFLSYKRNVHPDEAVAKELFARLAEYGHTPFIDQTMAPGTVWAERIEQELAASDWLVILLSRYSVESEMVRAELETARRLAEKTGKPRVLPVRLELDDALPYPLSAYLDGIQWAIWNREGDTKQVAKHIHIAFNGGDLSVFPRTGPPLSTRLTSPPPSAAVAPAHLAPGPTGEDADHYIERACDREGIAAVIAGHGTTVTIRGPRQMGKTTLMNRLVRAAEQKQKRIAVVDFKLFSSSVLNDPDRFFEQFCEWIADELDTSFGVDSKWSRLPRAQACTRSVRKILSEVGAPVVLGADELQRLFDSPVQHEFFGMLRSWHEARDTRRDLANLSMVLVTSIEPESFMRDDDEFGSPFNVAIQLELMDFSTQEVATLADTHRVRLSSDDLQTLMRWLGGHPYLTRRALYLLAKERWSFHPSLALTELAGPSSPFSDHLRHYLLSLRTIPRMAQELKRAILGQPCSDRIVFERLRGAGLIKGSPESPIPRCELYGAFFRSVLAT